MRRRQAALCFTLLTVLACGSVACGPSVTGTFSDVTYAPTGTAMAVVDRNTFVTLSGATLAVQRPVAQRSVVLLLTGALADPIGQWQQLPASQLLDLRKNAATSDGLLLFLPFDVVKSGAEITVEADSDVFLVSALPASNVATGLGAKISVKVSVDEATLEPGEVFSGTVKVTRERADGQPNDVASGEVEVPFKMRFAAERRGKSNLALLAPILRCAAHAGPVLAPGCIDTPAEPIVDATSSLLGP